MDVRLVRLLAAVVTIIALVGCQASEPVRNNPVVSDEGRALHKKLEAEAAALGTAQAVMSMPAAWDPTGMASLATIPAGLAAREAVRRRADALTEAQAAKDQAAFYRKYGLNPDGSPSGRKGPLSVD